MTGPMAAEVAPPHDTARRSLLQAAVALRSGRTADAQEPLEQAQLIVDELLATYSFCSRRLIEARLARDPAPVLEVAAMLGDPRESFVQP
jgi:flagellin-specific chaperone FliS